MAERANCPPLPSLKFAIKIPASDMIAFLRHMIPTACAMLGGILFTHAETTVTIHADDPGKPISADLFGIFFEDINYSADGGLYAELIQNRSFEYTALDNVAWSSFTSWKLEQRDGGKGLWLLEVTEPLHANNPHYVILRVTETGGGVGLCNEGFDGIPVKAGERYDISFFARQLYMNEGYGEAIAIEGRPMPMVARLEGQDGKLLGEVDMSVEGWNWKPSGATITATGSDANARFVLLAKAKGGIAIDHISLFPEKTFRGRRNGLRDDLARMIAGLHPKFMRFPGGCVAHGMGLHNIYRWKDTIGPVEQRRGQKNFWNYHQSVGLGYFEYFQFCEDIGAKPLPILAAGVSCPHSDQKRGKGQQCIPMADMPAYIQDIMDLIEWANGSASSAWGAKRAEAGHPEPFGLKYLGIGNEDEISPEFKERFKMIQDALRARHPEITVIGTAGSQPDGANFENGWAFARETQTPMVDEHYYQTPGWFLDNQHRYDSYDRKGPKVYLGEYASRGNTLFNALAEAAYMTSLERNGDIVPMASYAPLLAKVGHIQWKPDLIYFTNHSAFPSINYEVQRLFSVNSGDRYLETWITGLDDGKRLAVSTVRDSKSGHVILKIVNTGSEPVQLHLAFEGAGKLPTHAEVTAISGDPQVENPIDAAPRVTPSTSRHPLATDTFYEVPASSLTVIRMAFPKSQ